MAALGPAGRADSDPEFHVRAEDADAALRAFSRQAGVELVYSIDKVAGVETRAIDGDYSPFDALRRMLAGTPLLAVQDPATGALAVNRRAEAPASGRAPPPLPPAVEAAPGSAPAPAEPTSADAIVRLPQFQVSSSTGGRYLATDTVSAVRIRGSLADTPLSVSVVTQQLLGDLGADSAYDATRYFSGVSNGRGAGPGGILDRQDFRGFESFTRTVDGLSTLNLPSNNGFQANFDPAFVQRIEVVKGPDSILAPTGSPGGSMNVLTKSPSDHAADVLSVQVGNYDAGKATVDSTGPLPFGRPGEFAYRVIADYQDGRTYVPGSLRQWNLSAQFRWRISDTTQVTVKYFGQQWELTGAVADPNDDGWYVTDPGSVDGATISREPSPGSGFAYDGWNGDTTWSSRFDRVNMVTSELTSALWNRVSVRLAAALTYDDFDQNAGYLSAPPPDETWDPATGREVAIANNFNPANASEIANHVKDFNRDEQVQNDYAATFHPGGVSLQPVAGWTYQQGTNPPNYDRTAPLPNVDLLSGAPYDPPRPPPAAYTLAAYDEAHAWQLQAYAFAKAGFYGDRVFLLGGVSRLWTRNASTDLLAGATTQLQGKHDTYLGGALLKPLPELSLYYLFSTNAAITAGPQLAPLWQTGKQNEFGAKSELLDHRLSLTVAHFQIVQSNLSSPNPLYNTDPAHNPSTILTDEGNHGVEVELVGSPVEGLSVIASHTDMRLRDAYGRRQRNVPDTMSALLLRYAVGGGAFRRLSVFGGAIHTGDTAGETVTGFTPLGAPEQPGFFLPSWTVYNAGAGYSIGRERLQLDVENLLDSQFPWQPAGRNSVSPYPGRTVRLITTIPF